MRRVRGFTRVDLLVVVLIAAVGGCLSVLAINRNRENARRHLCERRLAQIGIALANYGAEHRTLPPGWIGVKDGKPDVEGGNAIGWAGLTLPMFPQPPEIPKFQPDQDLRGRENAPFREQPLLGFVCPSAGPSIIWDQKTFPAAVRTGNYVGNIGSAACEVNAEGQCVGKGPFSHNSHIRWGDEIDKSTLFLAGERSPASQFGPFAVWSGAIPDWRACLSVVAAAPQAPPTGDDGFSSFHPQGANVLYGDGRVRFLSTRTDATVMQAAADVPVSMDF